MHATITFFLFGKFISITVDSDHVSTIPDSFSCRSENLSGIVETLFGA